MVSRLVVAWVMVLAAGCQGTTRRDEPAPAACARVGDRCTVAAGKLGVCVDASVDGAASKVVCQSQH